MKFKEIIEKGENEYDRGNYENASKIFEKALNIAKANKEKSQICKALKNIGRIKFRLGQFQDSLDYFKDSLDIAEKYNFYEIKVDLCNHLGASLFILGKIEEAQKKFKEGLALSRKIGYSLGEAKILTSISTFFDYNLQNITEAQNKIENAIKIYKKIDNKRGIANALNNLGKIKIYITNEFQEALGLFQEALKIANELGNNPLLASIIRQIGYSNFKLGNLSEVEDYYKKALEISEKLKRNYSEKTKILFNYGEFWEYKHNFEKAEQKFKEALSFAIKSKNIFLIAHILQKFGEYYRSRKKNHLAFLLLTDSLSIFNHIARGFKNYKGKEDFQLTFRRLQNMVDELKNIIEEKEEIPRRELDFMKKNLIDTCKLANLDEDVKPFIPDLSESVSKLVKNVKSKPLTVKDLKKFLKHDIFEIYLSEWSEFLLMDLFEKLDESSKKELIIMDQLNFIFESEIDICLFIIFKVLERELRNHVFIPFKKFWESELRKKKYKYYKLPDYLIRSRKRLKILNSFLKSENKLTLGNMVEILNNELIQDAKNYEIIKDFSQDLEDFLGDENFRNIISILNSKIEISNKSYSLYELRNNVAHGESNQNFFSDQIKEDENIIIRLRSKLVLIEPYYLRNLLLINKN